MKKIIFNLIILCVSGFSHSSVESICGIDTRIPHKDMRIGRIALSTFESACTVTLIGKSCAITAGHCVSAMKKDVEFGVGPSAFGKLAKASPSNTFQIDHETILSMDDMTGNDWAVFNFKKNLVTEKFPGDQFGFYTLSSEALKAGDEISIAGYGKDSRGDKTGNGSLQISKGVVIDVTTSPWGIEQNYKAILHNVDTTPGNSGSVIVKTKTQEIVGIHTDGAVCSEESGNAGSVINSTRKMQKAIAECMGR